MTIRRLFPAAAAIALSAGVLGTVWNTPVAFAAEPAVHAPAPKLDPKAAGTSETAVFAGGCFWGVQGVFAHVKGVSQAVSGYTGGAQRTASYEDVSGGDTGHAESVRVTFDPRVVSYGKLLQIYFSVVADPTMLDAQGPDSGTQYRSALFPMTPQQRQVADGYLAQLRAAHLWKRPIVTRIEPMRGFFAAEAYHQNYLTLHPESGYIQVNDLPKVEGLKAMYPALYRAQPVMVRG